jgi:hypothetical protein
MFDGCWRQKSTLTQPKYVSVFIHTRWMPRFLGSRSCLGLWEEAKVEQARGFSLGVPKHQSNHRTSAVSASCGGKERSKAVLSLDPNFMLGAVGRSVRYLFVGIFKPGAFSEREI